MPALPTIAETLSLPAARRIALAAQGFAPKRSSSAPGSLSPAARVDRRHGRAVFADVGLIQIDSVNVLVRSQELPLFARLGAHPRDLIPKMLAAGELFEYWGHEASLLPVALAPYLRWRMAAAAAGEGWAGLIRLARDHGDYIGAVLAEVADRGPLSAGGLSDPGERGGPWWGRSKGKQALEYLFWTGQVTARRTATFERVYDLPERALPAAVIAAPTPHRHDAHRHLVAVAARSLGVATESDLADYFRMKRADAAARIAELVDEGLLVPTRVETWRDTAYLWHDARRPRRIEASALLSPFDSLVWERARTERLFNFRYRIEIYTPAPKRVYGYYVLPFLLGDQLVARVDLKADRHAGILRAHGVFGELGVPTGEVAAAIAAELRAMAEWLGLPNGVEVGDRGDLAASVRSALPRS